MNAHSFPFVITLSSLDENQLDEWFDHLDLVFEKTPRDYFVNHWLCDPWKDIKGWLLRVSSQFSGQIVSFGGIGEVSTKPAFRNKGLAKVLLHVMGVISILIVKKSTEFMKTRQIAISGLHTSSSAPLYASLGWQSKKRLFVHKTLDSFLAFETSESSKSSFKVRPSNLSNNNELETIVQLQRSYSSHFNGPFVRDEDYWRAWILKEIGSGCHYVLEDVTSTAPAIAAFILLDTKPRKFPETLLLVRDFGVKEDMFGKDRGKSAFLALVQHALHNTKSNNTCTHIRYPAPLFEEWESTADTQMETDIGVMYRVIDPTYAMEEKVLSDVMTSMDPHTHVFWDIDAF